jgi:mannitol/fructose-specific phosphotransferase system IIA component (Ntr-type)
MVLSDFVRESDIHLELSGETKDDVLATLVGSLELPDQDTGFILRVLQRREHLGSTGIGRGVAIPHCRTPVVSQLRIVFGRQPKGVDFDAVDNQPVFYIFLLVAPPIEVSNDYLPVLGRIAQLVKEPDVPQRLGEVTSPAEFLQLLAEKGV